MPVTPLIVITAAGLIRVRRAVKTKAEAEAATAIITVAVVVVVAPPLVTIMPAIEAASARIAPAGKTVLVRKAPSAPAMISS